MKIIHLSYSDLGGGAARAAFSLHQALKKKGVSSQMLVVEKLSDDQDVLCVLNGFWAKWKYKFLLNLEKIVLSLAGKLKGQVFSLNIFEKWELGNYPQIGEASVVALYWVGNGFLTPNQIRQISRPMVWRFSDLWPVTGGCHYSRGCEKYTDFCQQCPQMKWQLPLFDPIATLFDLKMERFKKKNCWVVAPSSWMAENVRRSQLFGRQEIQVVNTGVDHHFFSPRLDREKMVGNKPRPLVLLMGANNIVVDERKGFNFIIDLFKQLGERAASYHLKVFGVVDRNREFDLFCQNYSVEVQGLIQSQHQLLQSYQSGDIFLCPSREDNLPNTVLEAQACGLPVLAFAIEGLRDVLSHKMNSFLATPFETTSLLEGLAWLSDQQNLKNAQQASRQIIEGRFTRQRQVDEMLAIYQRVATCAG